ncbi:twin-arginine translocase subunit TatC [Candidatus Sumerlaeota bacterium]|nr:twin-arginine translocase subunit TatC [Candidatus Sumerlaeota bacterium]
MIENRPAELSVWDHWEELRTRIIRCIIALSLSAILGLFLSKNALEALVQPLARSLNHLEENYLTLRISPEGTLCVENLPDPESINKLSRFRLIFHFEKNDKTFVFGPDYRTNFYYFNPIDPFTLWLKASLILGVLIALPYVLFQVWAFVSPGLTNSEKRGVKPVLWMGFLLFPIGACFAYFMLQFALGFFTRYTFPGLEPRLGIHSYIGFALTLMLASGVVFELPVVVVILTSMGLVHPAFLRKYRRHAIILLFLLAAVVTPPDVFTMFAVAIPLLVLYEFSIILSSFIVKKRNMDKGNI